jgi:hypothetical protein
MLDRIPLLAVSFVILSIAIASPEPALFNMPVRTEGTIPATAFSTLVSSSPNMLLAFEMKSFPKRLFTESIRLNIGFSF